MRIPWLVYPSMQSAIFVEVADMFVLLKQEARSLCQPRPTLQTACQQLALVPHLGKLFPVSPLRSLGAPPLPKYPQTNVSRIGFDWRIGLRGSPLISTITKAVNGDGEKSENGVLVNLRYTEVISNQIISHLVSTSLYHDLPWPGTGISTSFVKKEYLRSSHQHTYTYTGYPHKHLTFLFPPVFQSPGKG